MDYLLCETTSSGPVTHRSHRQNVVSLKGNFAVLQQELEMSHMRSIKEEDFTRESSLNYELAKALTICLLPKQPIPGQSAYLTLRRLFVAQ